jgi:elongator complex protein 2
MARPQIHGYDLNCIDSLGTSQFVSGADEKLLRVFNEPKAVAQLLEKLCGFGGDHVQLMPDAANIPVLGLSNKAIEAVADDAEVPATHHNDRDAIDPASVVHKSTLALDYPPLEDHLSRHTLWPETEKLYGHGYEISCLAASHDGSIIATACKASSIDHAVIRLFETKDWHEIKPPLTAHSLTVTRLRFSADDKYLLSVGRDRQWAIFQRSEEIGHDFILLEANPKGHTRMILDAAWAPTKTPIFATAGREKQVKIWAKEDDAGFKVVATIPEEHPVTAIDFLNIADEELRTFLAVGTEAGVFKVYCFAVKSAYSITPVALNHKMYIPFFTFEYRILTVTSIYPCPSKAITQLAWKPSRSEAGEKVEMELAIASEDSSLRIYDLSSSVES